MQINLLLVVKSTSVPKFCPGVELHIYCRKIEIARGCSYLIKVRCAAYKSSYPDVRKRVCSTDPNNCHIIMILTVSFSKNEKCHAIMI